MCRVNGDAIVYRAYLAKILIQQIMNERLGYV